MVVSETSWLLSSLPCRSWLSWKCSSSLLWSCSSVISAMNARIVSRTSRIVITVLFLAAAFLGWFKPEIIFALNSSMSLVSCVEGVLRRDLCREGICRVFVLFELELWIISPGEWMAFAWLMLQKGHMYKRRVGRKGGNKRRMKSEEMLMVCPGCDRYLFMPTEQAVRGHVCLVMTTSLNHSGHRSLTSCVSLCLEGLCRFAFLSVIHGCW